MLRSLTRTRRLAPVLAFSFLLAWQSASGAIPAAQALQIVPIDPCLLAPAACSTLTFLPTGNGIGGMETLAGLGQPIDRLITCQRQGGTTYNTCSHRYYVGIGLTKTIYYDLEPAVGSKVCPTPATCTTSTLARSIVLTAGWESAAGATFVLAHPEKLTVSIAGAGAGHLLTQPIGIDCSTTCSADFNFGTDIVLYLNVQNGGDFRGWSAGPCDGQGTECHFKIGTDTTISAVIRQPLSTAKPPVATPVPTTVPTAAPTMKPVATPKVTTAPKATAAPVTVTPTPSSTPVAVTGPVASDAPTASDVPVATAAADPTVDAATTSPAAQFSGAGPTASSGSGMDVLPIAGAIVLAGLLIALAIVAGLRRRSPVTVASA